MLNEAKLIGRLGRDPEIRHSAQGMAVANFSVATTEKYKDKQSGEMVENTEWHRCVAFNRAAEVIGEYLTKGSLVYVSGKLRTRQWEDKDGTTKYTTEILVNDMKMLGGNSSQEPQQKQAKSRPSVQSEPLPGDDIPF